MTKVQRAEAKEGSARTRSYGRVPGDQIITDNKRLYNGMTMNRGGVHTINKPYRLGELKLRNNTKDTTKDNTDCDRGRHRDYNRE